jgi:hypothetical protein
VPDPSGEKIIAGKRRAGNQGAGAIKNIAFEIGDWKLFNPLSFRAQAQAFFAWAGIIARNKS